MIYAARTDLAPQNSTPPFGQQSTKDTSQQLPTSPIVALRHLKQPKIIADSDNEEQIKSESDEGSNHCMQQAEKTSSNKHRALSYFNSTHAIDHIYMALGLNPDYVTPFAAVPENGCKINGLDDRSEFAHCIMLVNFLHFLGAIKTKKASHQIVTCLTQVVLSLSPNHGLFDNDRLYLESKISLKMLFNHWSYESWGDLCLVGAVIG